MKTFKQIKEESEKVSDSEERRNRFNASRRLSILARQASFRNKIKRAMLRVPTIDVATDRARDDVKRDLQKRYLGTSAPEKYKDASFGKRIDMDKRLDKVVSPERKEKLLLKKARKVRKDSVKRRIEMGKNK